MKLWNFFKQKFNGRNSTEAAQTEVARFVNLAFSLIQSEHYVEASGLLLKALQHEAKIENPALLEWILMSLFLTWEQNEKYQESAEFFSEFLVRNPNHAVGFELRAASQWYGGRLNEAIEDYSRALELKPDYALALSGRGQVLVECGQFDDALRDLNKALDSIDGAQDMDPNWKTQFEAFARNGRAAAYAGLGNFAGALAEFDKSVGLWPENAWVYFNRAEAYRRQGDLGNAAENYSLALTKKQPKLTRLKRSHAEEMLRSLKA